MIAMKQITPAVSDTTTNLVLGEGDSLTVHSPATRLAISWAILCAASAQVGSSEQVSMSTTMAAAVVSDRRHSQAAPCWLVDAISIPALLRRPRPDLPCDVLLAGAGL